MISKKDCRLLKTLFIKSSGIGTDVPASDDRQQPGIKLSPLISLFLSSNSVLVNITFAIRSKDGAIKAKMIYILDTKAKSSIHSSKPRE